MADLWHISEEFPTVFHGTSAVAAAGVAMASAAGEVFVAVLNGGAGGMSRGLLGGLFRQDDFHAAPKGFADGLGGMI